MPARPASPAPVGKSIAASAAVLSPQPLADRQDALRSNYTRAIVEEAQDDPARLSPVVHQGLWADFRQHRADLAKRVAEAYKQAEALKKAGKLPAARGWATFAYLLDTACMRHQISNGQTGGKALALIEEIGTQEKKDWTKAHPGLSARLDLVLRDQPLADAVAAVARAAKLPVTLLPGSIEDACSLTGKPSLHVTWLDLRNATVAQALDWLLVPERMTWWVAKSQIVAGTVRRAGIEAPWVYDVSHIAIPTVDELKDEKDYAKRLAAVKKMRDDFAAAVRKQLGLGDDRVLWFGAGQLLVFADGPTHGRALTLLGKLADANATLPGELTALHALTAARAESRAKGRAARAEAWVRARVLYALDTFAWRLLAGAADGSLDMEALTELQIAWKSPAFDQVVEKHPLFPLRAAWAIGEAARALPAERELAALAATARTRTHEAATAAVGAFEKSPSDVAPAYLALVYATLHRRDDAEFAGKAGKVVTGAAFKPMNLIALRQAATVLLAPAGRADGKALVGSVRDHARYVRGDDAVLLTALACRKAGGDAWATFRAEARDLVGRQPLSGSVVVLINRLAGSALPILASGE
jgi:hypothetical protein